MEDYSTVDSSESSSIRMLQMANDEIDQLKKENDQLRLALQKVSCSNANRNMNGDESNPQELSSTEEQEIQDLMMGGQQQQQREVPSAAAALLAIGSAVEMEGTPNSEAEDLLSPPLPNYTQSPLTAIPGKRQHQQMMMQIPSGSGDAIISPTTSASTANAAAVVDFDSCVKILPCWGWCGPEESGRKALREDREHEHRLRDWHVL